MPADRPPVEPGGREAAREHLLWMAADWHDTTIVRVKAGDIRVALAAAAPPAEPEGPTMTDRDEVMGALAVAAPLLDWMAAAERNEIHPPLSPKKPSVALEVSLPPADTGEGLARSGDAATGLDAAWEALRAAISTEAPVHIGQMFTATDQGATEYRADDCLYRGDVLALLDNEMRVSRFGGPDCGIDGCAREVGHIGDHKPDPARP